jgi:hypothetical protein
MYDVKLTRIPTISEVQTGISCSVIQICLLNYVKCARTVPLPVEPYLYFLSKSLIEMPELHNDAAFWSWVRGSVVG